MFASFSVFDTIVLVGPDLNLGPFSVLIKGKAVSTLITSKNSLTGCILHPPVNSAEGTLVTESIQERARPTPRLLAEGLRRAVPEQCLLPELHSPFCVLLQVS